MLKKFFFSGILVILTIVSVSSQEFEAPEKLNSETSIKNMQEPRGGMDKDILTRLSELATALAFIVAAIALALNYGVYRKRVAFDSLIKLCEIFHIELENHRDKVVDVKISDDGLLDEHLGKLRANEVNEISLHRSIIKILNFYSLIGMMTEDRYLSEKIALRYFGSAICYKVEDWKALIRHLGADKNYKEMVEHIDYIYQLANPRKLEILYRPSA